MKFGDKLIQLRKKNGLSQEELAAKLNVSRQSVSKWESNNTYPETDKIVQICNIFDCTMDDLINENIKDITAVERKSRRQFNIYIESLLDFITKTINMFCNMKLFSIIKCLLEQSIIILVLIVIGLLISNIFTSVIGGVFSFLPWKVLHVIKTVISSILELILVIIIVIIVIHIFKIRYLNYYNEIINKNNEENDNFDEKDSKENIGEEVNKKVKEKKEKIKFENREARIVIRDKEPFAFLNVLAKMILWFIKFIAIMIGLFFAFILLLGIIGLVLSVSLSTYSNIFVGIDIGIIGLLIAVVLVLILLINFILENKTKIRMIICMFFISIIVMGVGIGISLIAFKNIKFGDDLNDILEVSVQEESISYVDNMIIVDEFPKTYEYIIDNNIKDEEVIILNEFNSDFYELSYYEDHSYGMKIFNFYLSTRINIKDMFDIIIEDLKNDTLRDYNLYYEGSDIKIKANSKTIDKLVNNFSKVYNYEKESTNTGFILSNISKKVKFIYDECHGEYNALTGEVSSFDEGCQCVINQSLLPKTIEYSCHYKDND